MQIWLADFSFELTTGSHRIIQDVVVKRVPIKHLFLHPDILNRATRSFSITEAKLLAKTKVGRYKVNITFTKKIGITNGSNRFSYA